jgi:hypothetical protein
MQLFDDFPYDFLRGPLIVHTTTAQQKPAQNKSAKGLVVEKGREPRRDNVKSTRQSDIGG